MWAEYAHIISDPGHILAEATFIAIEGLLISPVIAFLVRRHDRKEHAK